MARVSESRPRRMARTALAARRPSLSDRLRDARYSVVKRSARARLDRVWSHALEGSGSAVAGRDLLQKSPAKSRVGTLLDGRVRTVWISPARSALESDRCRKISRANADPRPNS